jgi:translation initiation factor eIF-2B subunit beta
MGSPNDFISEGMSTASVSIVDNSRDCRDTNMAAVIEQTNSDGVNKRIQMDNSDPANLRLWLKQNGHKKQVLLLDAFLHELRLLAATSTIAPIPHQQQSMEGPSKKTSPVGGKRYKVVHKTLNLIRHMIGSTSWKTAAEILCILRAIGSEIVTTTGTNQHDPAIENIIRRVMAAIREEAIREDEDATTAGLTDSSAASGSGGRLSLQSMLWVLPQQQKSNHSIRGSRHGNNVGAGMRNSSTATQRQESLASEEEMKSVFQQTNLSYFYPASFYAVRPNFKVTVMEAVQEILNDLEDMYRNINDQVMNYIHAGEIILTCGNSHTIELFLKAANVSIKQQQQHNQDRPSNPTFTVIVCGDGFDMACNLAAAGIDTTYIENAAVFAVMARVNKVLLPVHAVLANGGFVAQSGCNLVALAAHEMSVPVVCVTGLYKLCPMFPHEGQDTLQELLSPVPKLVYNYDELHDMFDAVELVNPLRDYIEPKLVSLYITNVGSFPPSFIYRLLAENYHSDDWKSFL